jgi:hypothetical protein
LDGLLLIIVHAQAVEVTTYTNHSYYISTYQVILHNDPVFLDQLLRTRTPTGGIQRSGSGLGNRASATTTTTAYGADGSRVTTTRTSSSYSNAQQQSQQQSRNW